MPPLQPPSFSDLSGVERLRLAAREGWELVGRGVRGKWVVLEFEGGRVVEVTVEELREVEEWGS